MTTVTELIAQGEAQSSKQMTDLQRTTYYLLCDDFAMNPAVAEEDSARLLRYVYKHMGLVGEEAGDNLTDEEIVAECREGN